MLAPLPSVSVSWLTSAPREAVMLAAVATGPVRQQVSGRARLGRRPMEGAAAMTETLVATERTEPLPELSFWFWRVLASALGWAMSVPVADAVLEALGGIMADGTVVHTMLGALSGTLQWLVLRRHIPRAARWVLVSVLAWALIGVLGTIADRRPPNIENPSLALALVLAAVEAPVAIPQWLVLRWHMAHVGWWLLASPAGLAAGLLVVRTLDGVVAAHVSETVGLVVAFGVIGMVSGAITGMVLTWLMRHPTAERAAPNIAVAA